MTDRHEQPSEILGSLPRTRPQRRSSKRGPAQEGGQHAAEVFTSTGPASPERGRHTGASATTAARFTATPPPGHPSTEPSPKGQPGLLRTLVQAGAELAEIGLSVSVRAVRDTVARLPRP
jgi:hypothetical protein